MVPRTLAFPKSQRGVLARRMQARAFDFMEAIQAGALNKAPNQSLAEADCHLAALRTYLRLSRDLSLFTPKQYEHGARLTVEVGRLLGGWKKQLARKNVVS